MSLHDFLKLLRQTDGITVEFSHLGYNVRRGDELLDTRGNHTPATPRNSSERSRKSANMYCALSVALMYASDDVRGVFPDAYATLNPLAKGC